MLLKSCNGSGICCKAIRTVALISAVASLCFFFGSSIEGLLGALLMLGVAVALEVIAAVVSENTTVHS